MRTTVEMRDDQRSALMALAAKRGEKGFSGVLEEAIDEYLDHDEDRRERARVTSELAGALSEAEADALHKTAIEIRNSWR